jgi:ADP-ribose pyrophosphatase YjhB (NUDIX family)
MNYYCFNKCCIYKIIPYKKPISNIYQKQVDLKIKKAGIFIYDSSSKKILLVQSRGQMWGCPKGSIKEIEDPLECAIREVKEETGIDIDEKSLNDFIIINSKVQYYFLEMKEDKNISVQNQIIDNDANGIGWFNIDCLYNLVKDGIININQHCRLLIKKKFNKEIPYNKEKNFSKSPINYQM